MSSMPLQQKPPEYGSLSTTVEDDSSHVPGRNRASLLARTLFSYVNPIMRVGNARQLNMEDLWALEEENTSATAYATFKKQLDRHKGSVLWALLTTHASTLFMCGIAALFSAGCAVFAPVVLHHMIVAFAAPQINLGSLSVWLGAFFASRLLNALAITHVAFALNGVALRISASLKALIFQKALKRSSLQNNGGATAMVDISNLYTSDVNNTMWAAFQINSLWILPLQIAAVVYLLYAVIGFAAFAGLVVIGATMASSLGIASVSNAAFRDAMTRMDARMKAIKEVFSAIQTIKFNAWEAQFAARIGEARALELAATAKYLYFGCVSVFVLWASPILVSTVSFAVYTLVLGEELTAAKAFTAVALFNAIRDPLRDLPSAILHLVQIKISLGRLSQFMALDEFNPENVVHEDPSQPEDIVIAIENGSFGWSRNSSDSESPVLRNVNLTVKRGDLVVVHGAVGAGKSALCLALLGEMDKLSGRVFVRGNGNVAYYSQQTWIPHMTIRDAILFGSAFSAQKYQCVLDSCGLLPDLVQFPGGDATEIGAKGVNLSGGQRARVALARACYSDAELLVLDSPLAAVDAVVQSEIFRKCVCGLLARKTIVLVTHNPDIIASKAADCTILVQDGELKPSERDAQHLEPRSRLYTTAGQAEDVPHETPESQALLADAGRLVEDEEREDGRVAKRVFVQYLSALGGWKIALFLVVVQLLWQAFQIGSDLWLSHWTGEKKLGGDSGNSTKNSESHAEVDMMEHNMALYALLCGGSAVMVLVRAFTVAITGLRASRRLFDAMTRSLLHAPLRFFDANPMGRIVNRYSDDVATVDLSLPSQLGVFLSEFFFTVMQLATAVFTVRLFGLLVFPLVYLYFTAANFYLAPSREIMRLWKVAASPALSHVSETEDGAVPIRAFGPAYVQRARATNFDRVDVNSRVWSVLLVIRQWFRLRMELLGCGVVVLVVSALVVLHDRLSPGLVGLAFSYALSVDSRLSSLVAAWSAVEVAMVGPERILEYALIPAEGSEKSVVVLEPPEHWPQKGAIQFEDVVFSYKPNSDDAVLKRLSFTIRGSEKVGIVGRTGAGKSSLAMALFRINELRGGCILIDGQDIACIPLYVLRSRLAIIPQTPVLFRGPLRSYLDPFAQFPDAAIWTALAKVELAGQVRALELQLAHELSDNGDNMSVGERQMLCLARALLTRSRVVVLDEATAAIDHATEHKLQRMIAREFADATVLTIAHRLATVLDADRIMVLSDGKVAEFDTPAALAQKSAGGLFYELAKEGGVLHRFE